LGEDTKELEDKIDIMVYKLYELTYEEVKIVDPEIDTVLMKFDIGGKDYEKMSVMELSRLVARLDAQGMK
ncbi:MAG: hypothetical protein DRJ01_12185, partial [Bacteroidetes bacterium]